MGNFFDLFIRVLNFAIVRILVRTVSERVWIAVTILDYASESSRAECETLLTKLFNELLILKSIIRRHAELIASSVSYFNGCPIRSLI